MLDIAIVSFIIYRVLVILTGTRAVQLVKGVLFLIVVSTLASVLRMRLLSWFIGNVLLALSFSVPIVFQPELRKMLEELGSGQLNILRRTISDDEARIRAKQLSSALFYLKAHKIGALLVLQRSVGLADYYNTAIHINSEISQELIISIFWKDNPLHDGAVILNRSNIIAAGCYLPLADAPEISRWYGTRHRAALGISELSDALVFIVSEERGDISLANKGRLSKNLKDFQVDGILQNYFSGFPSKKPSAQSQFLAFWPANFWASCRSKLHELASVFWPILPSSEATDTRPHEPHHDPQRNSITSKSGSHSVRRS